MKAAPVIERVLVENGHDEKRLACESDTMF